MMIGASADTDQTQPIDVGYPGFTNAEAMMDKKCSAAIHIRPMITLTKAIQVALESIGAKV